MSESIIQSLSANVLRLGNECRELHAENARLNAEVERLRKMSIDPAQVKKLVEDGVQDRPYHYTVKYTVEVSRDAYLRLLDVMTAYWNAAKEGKPSV